MPREKMDYDVTTQRWVESTDNSVGSVKASPKITTPPKFLTQMRGVVIKSPPEGEPAPQEEIVLFSSRATVNTDPPLSSTDSSIPKGGLLDYTYSNVTQTDKEGQVNKSKAQLEYEMLCGEMKVRLDAWYVEKIVEDTVIGAYGLGNQLSGPYYVSGVTYNLDASEGLSMSIEVHKTGFGQLK